LRAMIAAGYEVHAFAMDYTWETEAEVRELGAHPVAYSMSRTGTNPLAELPVAWQLSHKLRDLEVEAVFSYFIKPVIYATLAARLAGIERRYALLPGLGYAFASQGGGGIGRVKQLTLKGVISRLLRLVLPMNQVVFLYNDDDEREMRRLNRRGNFVRINGTGIELHRYPFTPPHHNPPTFLLAARLLVEKGIREYAAAARIVKDKHPGSRFILLGPVDSNPGGISEQEVRGWVAEGLFEWPGSVPDIRSPWLEQTSVYVLPSYYREGVPRSTQEALAMGRPVITCDSVGCRETVVNGRNGYLLPPRDAQSLAEAMLRFIRYPELITTMGWESYQLAKERFDVNKINKLILKSISIA
jgi:glycosyltransferase involved in cell wall biosynthesis